MAQQLQSTEGVYIEEPKALKKTSEEKNAWKLHSRKGTNIQNNPKYFQKQKSSKDNLVTKSAKDILVRKIGSHSKKRESSNTEQNHRQP